MNIAGHSGCDLQIKKIGKISVVTKSTDDALYIPRLKLQAKKQRKFCDLNVVGIHIPKIYGEFEIDGYYSFDMEYCDGMSFVSFFELADKQDLLWFFGELKQFINNMINCSAIVDVLIVDIVTKIKQVKNSCNKTMLGEFNFEPYFIWLIDTMESFGSSIALPVGPMHGDLTLSNIMVKKGEYISLFDFLDSFIESPLLDIVKIRQDTSHYWSLNMLTKETDLTRLKILLNYLDNLIVAEFSKVDFYSKYYTAFQVLNLLRILPYAKQMTIVSFLNFEINKLISGERV